MASFISSLRSFRLRFRHFLQRFFGLGPTSGTATAKPALTVSANAPDTAHARSDILSDAAQAPGWPDGFFSDQKSQFGYILEDLGT
jgi:hypothetical protein